jgi:hypothetical protein
MSDNIKMELKEILSEDEDWIQLAQYMARCLALENFLVLRNHQLSSTAK